MRADSSIQWSAYPALLLAGAFALGILLESVSGGTGVRGWGTGIGVGAALFGGAWWWERRRLVSLAPLCRTAALGLVVLCAGGARHALSPAPSAGPLNRVAAATGDRPLRVVGTVEDAPERAASSTRFTLRMDSVGPGGHARPLGGRIRVTFRPSPWAEAPAPFPRVRQGDRLRVRGAVQPAPGQRNPGGFDYAAYLARRGVCCVMYVGDGREVAVRSRGRSAVLDLIVGARHHVRRQVRRYVPSEDGRAVLRALLLGDRSRISDAQRDRFARTGLMHLLAVSGLHVFLVGMVLYVLLRPLLMRLRLGWHGVEVGRAVLTVVILSLYMALTGARPSVVRAVVMSALFIGGTLFQRSSHPLNTLGVAAIVLLGARSPALFDVGFQLSMAAVGALVVLHPRLMAWIPERWTRSAAGEWAASVTIASVAATLGTAPVLLAHFGWVSGAGLLLNVFGIPCTGLALSAALGMVVVGEVGTVVGGAFGSTADLFVRGLLLTSRWGAEWFGWMGLRWADPGPWLLGALLAGTATLAQWPRPRHRWRCVIVGLLLLAGGVWTGAVGRDSRGTLDVLFFDVGQGDAVLVTTPGGERLLVDTGPQSPTGSAAVSSTVLPYLRRRGVGHLDLVVITHPDEDHLGGLPALLKEVSIGRVLHSGQRAETDLYRRSRRLLRRRDVPAAPVDRGDAFPVGGSVRVQVLGPPVRPGRRGVDGENGRSVVLHLAYGHADVLLPGDVEVAAERDLVRTYGGQLASRIVKVPHHGSETSSTEGFVERVVSERGTEAVVSVGESNPFGMPDSSVVARWRSNGAHVRTTARAGAVWLRSDGRKVWEVEWK